MAQSWSRDNRLVGRNPADVPNWMAIRDADIKRRNDHQAKLRAARLARDANQAPGAAAGRDKPRGKKQAKT